MKDILVLVATGFEDVELIAALDVYSRAELTYDLVSVENKTEVKGKFNASVKTLPLKDIDTSSYKLVFLPGGPGVEILLETPEVASIVKSYALDKHVAAICAAPEVLFRADVLKDIEYTSYPGYAKSENNTGQDVVVSNNIITGKDFRATIAFADAVVEELK